MSISNSNNRNDYIGNGSADTYNYTFRIFNENDLTVTVRNTSDVETTLVISTDYTVTGVGSTGGTIVLVNSSQSWLDAEGDLKSGYALTIRRVLDLVQETDIRNQGAFFPEIHEDQFDKLTMIDQQQQDEIDRSLKLPETLSSSSFSTQLPTSLPDNPGATVIVNSTGDGFEVGPTADTINQANADAAAAAASETAAANHVITASRWANETADTVIDANTLVDSNEFSAKEYAQGTQAATGGSSKNWAQQTGSDVTGASANSRSAKSWSQDQLLGATLGGSAKDWAQYTGGTVDDTEYSAKKYASDAALSAAAAASASTASLWNNVAFVNSASSPITITTTDAGTIYECDCSSGNIVINLPLISGIDLSYSWAIGVKKTDSSTNTVTINRNGTDLIDGSTSKVVSRQYAGVTLIPDTDNSPDSWTSISFGEMPIAGAVVGTTDTQVLTNKTFDDAVTFKEVTTPSTPSAGYRRIYPKTDGWYEIDDGGLESPLGSGSGSGTKNYFSSVVNSGLSVGAFTAYADAAGLLPVDGTGGSSSANLTLTASTTSPLSGLSSLVLSKSGSVNMQGYGFSYDMTIDPSDKGKVLSYTMNYGISSGTYSDDNVIVYFYDVTNSLLLEPVPYKIKNHTLISDRYFSEIQVPYNCSTLRFIIHVASTTTNNFDLKIDDLVFGPQSKQYGAVVTDWNTNWTPTGSWTTNTTYTGKYRQVGDSAEIQYSISLAGAPNSTGLSVNLPSTLTIDSSKIAVTGYQNVIGVAGAGRAGSGTILVPYYNTTSSFLVGYDTGSGTYGQVTQAAPSAWASGDTISIFIKVPIVGWSSSQQLSSESATRPVKAIYKLTTTQTLNASTDTVLDYDTKIEDSHGLVSGTGTNWKFTSKIQGTYSVKASVMFTSASWLVSERPLFRVFKNGVEYGQLNVHYFQVNVTTALVVNGALDVPLNAGDYITIVVNHNRSGGAITTLNATANSFVSIHMIQGPSQIAASESVYARYETSAGQSIASGATPIVDFGTKINDNTGAVTTGGSWKFAAPISGWYSVSAMLTYASASWVGTSFINMNIYKNGTLYSQLNFFRIFSAATTSLGVQGHDNVYLLAGEYIDIRTAHAEATARSLITLNTHNHVSITRLGN